MNNKNKSNNNKIKKNINYKNKEKSKKTNKFNNQKNNNEEKEYEDLVIGKNAIKELLKTDREINKVFIQKGLRGFEEIYETLRKRQVIISFVDKEKLNKLANNHMGIIASVPPFDYVSTDDILEYAKSKGEKPFILILDKIQDTYNLGAIIRTAVCSGVHRNNIT